MSALLRSLPPVVLVLAAVDTLLVRWEHPWRTTNGIGLYLGALALWGVLALVACVPAALVARVLGRRSEGRGESSERPRRPVWPLLAFFTLLPVLAHGVLDRHSGLGGSLSALAAPRPWVELALAVGLAAGAALLAVRGAGRLSPRASMRGSAALVLVAVLAGLFLSHRGESPGAGAAASASRPNVLLLVWDTCRADRLETYGYGRGTSPALAELSQDAIVFDEAVSVACFTFTSHLSLLTGAMPSRHGGRLIASYYDPRKSDSIAVAFQDAGYRTGAFVGTDVLNGGTGLRYGFERYDDQVDPAVCDTRAWGLVHDLQTLAARLVPALRFNGRPHWIQDFQRPAEEVLASAEAWIANGDPRPWFCFVNLYDVHWPYLPEEGAAEGLVRDYDGEMDGFLFRSDAWVPGRAIEEEDRRHVGDLYDAEILELDRTVAGFFERLDLERTAFLLTADHGEAFGEGGRWKHEDVLEPQVRVPLIVRPAGGVPGGRRVAARASGVDVAPTLLALAGIGSEAATRIDGVDLTGEAGAQERVVVVEDRDHIDPTQVTVALYRGPWKLVRRGLGEEARFELFDLRSDPVGEHDVSAEHPELADELAALLVERRRAVDEVEATADIEAGAQADALKGLGYTDR